MKKTEYKAHYGAGQPTTTTHISQQKIKNKRGSKPVPPEVKAKKITEYFAVQRPPDEIKKQLEIKNFQLPTLTSTTTL